MSYLKYDKIKLFNDLKKETKKMMNLINEFRIKQIRQCEANKEKVYVIDENLSDIFYHLDYVYRFEEEDIK